VLAIREKALGPDGPAGWRMETMTTIRTYFQVDRCDELGLNVLAAIEDFTVAVASSAVRSSIVVVIPPAPDADAG
jgi:hypothetical protein